jgi:hypothetical protein
MIEHRFRHSLHVQYDAGPWSSTMWQPCEVVDVKVFSEVAKLVFSVDEWPLHLIVLGIRKPNSDAE